MKLADIIQNKLLQGDEAERYAYRMGFTGKKVVFTNGCFDVLHHGHLSYLREAAELGDILIVGLNSDASVKRLKGESRPLNNEADRILALSSLLFVDAVVVFDEDTPEALIKRINPHVLVKGGDYTEDAVVGAAFVKAAGGEVKILPFVDGYSTTGFIEKVKAQG